MKNSEKLIVGVIAIYIILSLVGGSFNPYEWSFVQRPSGTLLPPTGVVGMFDMGTKGYDSLDISSVLTENSAYHCYWYAYRGGWLMLGKGDSATIELTEADGGYVHAVIKLPSGQNYYVDWSETKAKNPRVESVSFEDVDNDGYKDFIFKLNMANIPKPATGNPKINFYPYFLAYEKPTLNAPSDITGLTPNTLTTKYIEWYVYYANVRKAFEITKVEIVVGTTDTTKIQLKSVAIPGIGVVSGDSFGTPLKGTSTLTWTYTIGSNLYNALAIKYPANTLNKFYFTTEVQCLLGSNETIAVTITIYGLTPTGTLTTLTDTVNIQSSA